MPGHRGWIVAVLATLDIDPADRDNIVILPEPTGVVYTRAQQLEAANYLNENAGRFNFWEVGIGKDRLVIFMNPGATAADRQAILNASPISLIDFVAWESESFMRPH